MEILEELWWVDMQRRHHTSLKRCLALTNRWISPWPLTRITFCCLLLSVSFVQAAYDDLMLYFQPSALSVMAEDKRGLNIRSISMDFERILRGPPKAKLQNTKKKKISPLWFMVQRLCLFQDTHKTTSVNTNIVIRICNVISVCILWHEVKI